MMPDRYSGSGGTVSLAVVRVPASMDRSDGLCSFYIHRPAAAARDGGFILLDAVVAVFVLSLGFLSVLYGVSVFMRTVGRFEHTAKAYIGDENARTDAWFALPGAEE